MYVKVGRFMDFVWVMRLLRDSIFFLHAVLRLETCEECLDKSRFNIK